MKESITNALRASNMKVPPEREISKRLKGFYSSRRNVLLTRMDEDKSRKRKHALKASRRTFNARGKAVAKAVKDGKLDPTNEKEVSVIRKSVPQIPLDSVSPPLSNDEEAKEQSLHKRLLILEKARLEKRKRRNKHSNWQRDGSCSQVAAGLYTSCGSPQLFSEDMEVLARETDDDETQLP